MKVKYGPYSSSRLDVAQCPKRFEIEYIKKINFTLPNLPSRRGNAIHETFEEITQGWLRNEPLSWDQVHKVLTDKITKFQVGDGDIETCIGAAKAYMENPPEGLETILGTEEALAVKWCETTKGFIECKWDDPEAYVRGKIDLLMVSGNKGRIVDHKTQMHMCKANTFQMGLYAWLVKKFYPYLEEIETVLHFCHPSLDRYSHPETWDTQSLKEVEDILKIKIDRAENLSNFTAQPNDGCQYCPIVLKCDVLKDAMKFSAKAKPMFSATKNVPILTAKQAQEVAGQLVVISETKTILEKSLQQFVKEIGPVVIPGKEFAYKKSESWELKPGQAEVLFDLLKSGGVDPLQVFTLDIRTLQKSWKAFKKPYLEKIKENLRPTAKTTWGSRKV